MRQHHAPAQAPTQPRRPVPAEVIAGAGQHDVQHVGQRVSAWLGGAGLGIGFCIHRLPAQQFLQRREHRTRRHDAVRQPGFDGALRHARKFRRCRGLHQREAARRLDRLQPCRAIVVGAAEHDAQTRVAEVLSHRGHEEIDGLGRRQPCRCCFIKAHPATAQCHQLARWHDINMTARDGLPRLRFTGRKCPGTRQQFRQVADMVRRQVRHDHEAVPRIDVSAAEDARCRRLPAMHPVHPQRRPRRRSTSHRMVDAAVLCGQEKQVRWPKILL